MEMERNVELGINKDIVNSLIKYHFIRLTNIAASELGTNPEVTWDILKATQLVVQAAKFAQKLDYHRCYAIILDLEGMDQHTNYKDLKDSLTVLKKVYATQKEAALLEPVQVSHTFPVVKRLCGQTVDALKAVVESYNLNPNNKGAK